MTRAEGGRGAGRAGTVGRVSLPGTDELVIERRPEGGFAWSVSTPGGIEPAELADRARRRLRECGEAVELCDVWLRGDAAGPLPATSDDLLDSRLRYTGELRFLEAFLSWAEREPGV